MSHRYGLIAEDASDIAVIKTFARKITGRSISESHFVGKGCGPIRKKAPGWCKVFITKGCSKVVLVNDRDANDASELKLRLENAISDIQQDQRVVVIPVEEIEAWLLSDENAISRALRLNPPMKEQHHPETIRSPKEFLGNQVWKASRKATQYVNSVHNPLIAEHIDVRKVYLKCPSFHSFAKFFGYVQARSVASRKMPLSMK